MLTAQTPDRPRRASDIRLLGPADLPSLSALLCRCFGAPSTAHFASQEMLAWKYLSPAGSDTTSYVVERDGRIVAHAGVLRATIRGPGGAQTEFATVIDWAADSNAPGAGLALYRHAMRQAEATYLIGGAPTTQMLADRLGFRRAMDAHVYTRWVRPVGEFLRRPKDSRSWLRLAHGIAGMPFRRLAPRRGWLIARVPAFDDAVSGVLASNTTPHACAQRGVAILNHRLACPARRMRAHVLIRRGVTAGVAVSSIGAWDAKILFVHLDSADPGDWSAAYSLVTGALARERRVCRVSVLTSAAQVEHAMDDNHFWSGGAEPVLFYDPASRAAGLRPIDISYFDTDFDFYRA